MVSDPLHQMFPRQSVTLKRKEISDRKRSRTASFFELMLPLRINLTVRTTHYLGREA